MSLVFGLGPLAGLRLQAHTLQLHSQPGPLLPQIEAALEAHGRPLRWAVTAVERGDSGDRRLQIEAVLLVRAQSC